MADLSPAQALTAVLGAGLYAAGGWIRARRITTRRPNPDQAEVWAEGFRAGVHAAITGHPEPNPYAASPHLDVRQDT